MRYNGLEKSSQSTLSSHRKSLKLELFDNIAMPLATVFVFLTTVSIVYVYLDVVFRGPSESNFSTLEKSRRSRLRSMSKLYQMFESGIDDLTKAFGDSNETIVLDEIPWMKHELTYASLLFSSLVGFACFGITLIFAPIYLAPITLLVAMPITFFWVRSSVLVLGSDKRKSLFKRLPYVVDLLALVMEAGGSFQDALRTVAIENSDHIIGDELNEVATQIDQGKIESDALRDFSDRYNDENIRQFVSSINQGSELGVPIAKILRNQSDEILKRRSEWIEKASAEAKVKISGPGFVIALACMMIMVFPFILQIVGALF